MSTSGWWLYETFERHYTYATESVAGFSTTYRRYKDTGDTFRHAVRDNAQVPERMRGHATTVQEVKAWINNGVLPQ